MDLSVETITATQAEGYLKCNTSNRPLRSSLVKQYAKDMAAGHWKLSHQGIAFNCDGTLLDGQHRLKAIVESGVAVQMLVARNVDSRSQLVMDDHAKRNAADALSLARHEHITTQHIAIIRSIVDFSSTNGTADRLTKHEIDQVIDLFKPALDFVDTFMPLSQRGVTSAPVKAGIVLAWYYVKDLERLMTFCDVLTGKTLADGDGDRGAILLREWLLRHGVQGSTSRREAFKKTQRAIVAFLERKEIGKLYGTATHYPWPLIEPERGSMLLSTRAHTHDTCSQQHAIPLKRGPTEIDPVQDATDRLRAAVQKYNASDPIDIHAVWPSQNKAIKGLRITRDVFRNWIDNGCPYTPGNQPSEPKRPGRYSAFEIILWVLRRRGMSRWERHFGQHGVDFSEIYDLASELNGEY